jgi:hypothetical protein
VEICKCGYLDTVLAALDSLGEGKALERYLNDEGLAEEVEGVSGFIKRRDRLKVPIARAVADVAIKIGQVPPFYQQAIERAVAFADSDTP